MPADLTVTVHTRDLFFRSRLEAVVRAGGGVPARPGTDAPMAVVELVDQAAVETCASLVARGCRVLAFGPHVEAERLRAARAAGAEAVTNSQVEAHLGRMLADA